MHTQDLLAKLISFPTVSACETMPLINWAAEYLRGCAAHVDIIPAHEKGKASLWARLGPNVAGGVVLAGHIDVVPVDGQSWSTPPFTATHQGGRIYARGACDMKGFVACVLALAKRIDIPLLTKPLYIALTYNEEVDMAGATELAAWVKQHNISADWLWVGEPTELQVVNAHKGSGSVTTTIRGLSTHSSLPHKGISAVEMGVKVCDWIMRKSETFATMPVLGSPFDPPYSSINIGVFNGGSASNIVADTCKIEWQYRLHPGDNVKTLFKEYELMLDNTVRPLLARFPQTGIQTTIVSETPPFMVTENSASVKFLCGLTGHGTPVAVSYATEAGIYQSIAKSVVICGPGSISKAHQPDEFVPIGDLEKCDKLLDICVQQCLC